MESTASAREGVARVVAVEGDRVWLEPVPSGGCGACSAAQSCTSKGVGTLASRLETKRFYVVAHGWVVGDRVVVTFGEHGLVGMATLAYAIPLLTSLALALAVDVYAGQDALTLFGAVVGLAVGFGFAKLGVMRFLAPKQLQPQIVRRFEDAPPFMERN